MLTLLQQFINISDPDQLYSLQDDASNTSPIHFFWKNTTGNYLGCSDPLAKNLGFHKASELHGRTDFDLCWAAFAPNFKLNDDQVLHSKKSQVFIETGQFITGKIGKAVSYKSPLRLRTTKKVVGVICVAIEFDHANFSKYDKSSLSDDFLASYSLPKRQKECLYYLSKGMSIKQIALRLMLSPRTVEHYLEIVKDKLGCYSRAQLIDKILTE